MKRNPNTTVLLSFLLVLFSACTGLMLVSFKSKSQRLFKVPNIINELNGKPICMSPNFMMLADHRVERIEKFGAVLDLTTKPKLNEENYCSTNTTGKAEDYFSDGGLKVIVDTQHEIGVCVREGMPAVQGFPVYVVNQGTHKIAKIQTQNNKLNMVVEALSTKNTWEPIEYLPAEQEKGSSFTLSLPPQHYALSSNIVHWGDHITRCRVKLMSGNNVYYSNVFWMGINYTQFERS